MKDEDKINIVLSIIGLRIVHDKFTTFTILSGEYGELDYDFVSMVYDLLKDSSVSMVQLMNKVREYECRVEGIQSN